MKKKNSDKKIKQTLIAVVALFFCITAAVVFALKDGKPDTPPPPDSSSSEPGDIILNSSLKTAHDKNSDAIGWLKLPSCEIDNVVFQGEDNDEYLRVNEEGASDVWGCYFLDYINANDGYRLPDRVCIIYGHSLEDDPEEAKFSKLKRYKDRRFARENPYIEFSLLYRDTKWQIFSACDIPITIDYIDPNPDDEKYAQTLQYMLDNSYVDFGVEAGTDDQILVLSTCTSDENVRFVIAAKLLNSANDTAE